MDFCVKGRDQQVTRLQNELCAGRGGRKMVAVEGEESSWDFLLSVMFWFSCLLLSCS